jgi:hypothetical protein
MRRFSRLRKKVAEESQLADETLTVIGKVNHLAQRIEVEYEGKKVAAEQLEFTAKIPEPWAIYEVEDGTQVKIKPILTKVFRIIDQYLPNGDPVYGLQLGNLPVFSYAPNLSEQSSTEKEHQS